MKDRRFVEERERKKYQIKRLWDVHHEIVRRLVIGQKPREIAEALHITPQTVSNVRNSPLVQRQILMLQAQRDASAVDLRKRVEEIAPKAVALIEKKLEEELEEGAEVTQVGMRAALGALDIAIPRKSELEVKHGVSAELMEEIKKRAAASKMLVEEGSFEIMSESKEG